MYSGKLCDYTRLTALWYPELTERAEAQRAIVFYDAPETETAADRLASMWAKNGGKPSLPEVEDEKPMSAQELMDMQEEEPEEAEEGGV